MMAYLSVGILILSTSFFIYKYPPKWLVSQRTPVPKNKQHSTSRGISSKIIDENAANPSATHLVSDWPSPEDKETPKANPAMVKDGVPTFSLNDCETSRADVTSAGQSGPIVSLSHKTQLQPGTPALSNSVPMASPKRPASSLMPPPIRLTSTPKGPSSSAAGSLRIPTSGSLPNGGPPANSQQRASGGLTTSGTVSTPKTRGKVLLAPGHSPMDWAALIRSRNLSGVPTLQRVPPSQLRAMNGRKGKPAWSSWQGKVYNITPYLPFHPGGEAELMKAAGRDGKKLFMEVHPWVNWENMLGSCLVGVMVPENHGDGKGEPSLEDMD